VVLIRIPTGSVFRNRLNPDLDSAKFLDPDSVITGSQNKDRLFCCFKLLMSCGAHGNFPLLRALLNLLKGKSRP
jgi:hypothetical protein